MSRRTRLRHTSHRFQLGRIHHNRYALSPTYFPQTYSIFGSPIDMPTRFMPILENNTLHYISKEKELLNPQCSLFTLSAEQLCHVKTVNITIAGHITNTVRKSVPNLLFVAGMALCCFVSIFNEDSYRRRFFTRYSMDIEEYQALGEVIKKLQNCDNLIINIQDNKLTAQKMKLLTTSIISAMCSSPSPSTPAAQDIMNAKSQQTRKHVTIRNYCYFMRDMATDSYLGNLQEYENINAIFVWEKIAVYSGKQLQERSQSQTLMEV